MSLNSKPARLAFSKSRCRFSSAVTSIVRNCRKLKNRFPFFGLRTEPALPVVLSDDAPRVNAT